MLLERSVFSFIVSNRGIELTDEKKKEIKFLTKKQG
jgi:hypothetical protein